MIDDIVDGLPAPMGTPMTLDPQVRNVLLASRWILDDPARWTRGEFFRDAAGRAVLPSVRNLYSPLCHAATREASTCCLLGAVLLAAHHFDASVYWANHALARALGVRMGALSKWQDVPERTHAEVIGLLDRALATGDAR